MAGRASVPGVVGIGISAFMWLPCRECELPRRERLGAREKLGPRERLGRVKLVLRDGAKDAGPDVVLGVVAPDAGPALDAVSGTETVS